MDYHHNLPYLEVLSLAMWSAYEKVMERILLRDNMIEKN